MGLASIAYKFFDKKSSGGVAIFTWLKTLAKGSKSDIKKENISNKKLAGELHKSIIRTFKKRKVYSSFVDNICGDLGHMQLIIRSNKEFRFLLRVFDLFTKYAWDISLKNKKGITIITNAFQKILDESNRKPNKIWAA